MFNFQNEKKKFAHNVALNIYNRLKGRNGKDGAMEQGKKYFQKFQNFGCEWWELMV